MKRLILGVAAALVIGAGPAAADGLPTKSHVRGPVEHAPHWTGFYIGGGFGVGAVVHDLTVSEKKRRCKKKDHGPSATSGEHEHECEGEWEEKIFNFDGIGGEGFFGTVILGYDRLLRPGWVGGVFVDYDFSHISTDVSFSSKYGSFSTSLDHSHSLSVGARLGMLSSPTTLWYATAGYTRAEFDDLPTFQGYFVGAGVESILRGNWSLRLEYRFTQLGSENIFNLSDENCWREIETRADLEPSMHTARLVLSYKFGHRD